MNTMRVCCGGVILGALCVGVGVGAGCEKKDEPNKTLPKPPPPDVTPKAGGAVAGAAAGEGGAGVAAKSPTSKPTTDDAVVTVSPDVSAGRTKEAQDLLAGAKQAITESRLDDARASLERVEGMKDSISKATREQYESVRGKFNTVEKLQRTEPPAPSDPENK